MPRKPRIHFPGAVYHVILRGNAGEPVFFAKRDRLRFYLFLQECVERFSCRAHGFCCMTNHIHLILQVLDAPLSLVMQNLSLRYTKWINFSQQRTGHIFQGRYKALLIDADHHLLELVRYVHLNPVRAQLVKLPEQYPWSGHHCYLGNECLPWLTTDWVLSLLGRTDKIARSAYREFVYAGIKEERRTEFHSGTWEGRILGDDRFIDAALATSMEQNAGKQTLQDIIAAVCTLYGIDQEQMRALGKARPYSEAKGLVAAIVHESQHLSLCELAKFLNRDVSGLSKAAQRTLFRCKSDRKLAEKLKTIREQLADVQMSNLTPERGE